MAFQASSPYLSGVPGVGSTYAQYYGPQLVPAMLGHDPSAAGSPLGVMQQPVMQQKLQRNDRLEVNNRALIYMPTLLKLFFDKKTSKFCNDMRLTFQN